MAIAALVTDGFDVFEGEDFEDEGLVRAVVVLVAFLARLTTGVTFLATVFLAGFKDDGRVVEAGDLAFFATALATTGFAFVTTLDLAGEGLETLDVAAGFLATGADFLPFDTGAAGREDTDRFLAACFFTMGIAKILEVLPVTVNEKPPTGGCSKIPFHT